MLTKERADKETIRPMQTKAYTNQTILKPQLGNPKNYHTKTNVKQEKQTKEPTVYTKKVGNPAAG